MERKPSFLKQFLSSPYGKARVREYYAEWTWATRGEFRLIERRGGLLLSFILAAAAVGSDAIIFGTSPQSMRAFVALVGGLLMANLIALLVALVRAPSRIALINEFEEDETIDTYAEFWTSRSP